MSRRTIDSWGAFPFLAATLLSAPLASATVVAVDPKLPATMSAPAPAADPIPTIPAAAAQPGAPADTLADQAPAPHPDAREVECVAKMIIHEAGAEPHAGQVAVAQVVRRRMRDGRFGATACGVIKQRGQFFDVDAYAPARDTPRWNNAVAIATDVLAGTGDEVAPGALFFHAVRSGMPGNRVRIAQIGGHLFYR